MSDQYRTETLDHLYNAGITEVFAGVNTLVGHFPKYMIICLVLTACIGNPTVRNDTPIPTMTAVATSHINLLTATSSAPDAVDAIFFCSDSRPLKLIETLQNAVRNQDGQQFANLISPNGIYMSLYPAGRAIHLTIDEVRGFFDDDTIRDWGTNQYSGSTIQESLADGITALLEEVLLPENANIACNDNQDSLSNRTVLYSIYLPDCCTESNFCSVMRPGPPGYELEWGAWVLSIGKDNPLSSS
ncbi:hypothetical protein ACFLYO_02095 [Chloroflexota bacterium]